MSYVSGAGRVSCMIEPETPHAIAPRNAAKINHAITLPRRVRSRSRSGRMSQRIPSIVGLTATSQIARRNRDRVM